MSKSRSQENQNEKNWDNMLRIHTSGRDDSHADQYRYPYEPTPYCVLERLANSGWIRKGTHFWIMAVEKEESTFSCRIRRGAAQSESSMMSAFLKGHRRINNRQFQLEEPNSSRRMRNSL